MKAAREINEKIANMRTDMPYKFFKLYLHEPCFKLDKNDLKVGYLNINGLYDGNHGAYVNSDRNLLKLHILGLSDTKLSPKHNNESLNQMLIHWTVVHRFDTTDGRRHMGLLILTPKIMSNSSWKGLNFEIRGAEEVKKMSGETTIQVVNCSQNDELVSFLYVNAKPNNEDVEKIQRLIFNSNYTFGDLNLNPEIKEDRKKLDHICGKSKMMHLKAINTDRRNQLDHIIIDTNKKHQVYTDAFFSLATYHKTIVMRKSCYASDEIIPVEKPTKDDIMPEKITIKEENKNQKRSQTHQHRALI